MSKDDEIWDSYGADDAYFAVSTFDKFRGSNLDDAARREFFESGKRHVVDLFDVFESEFGVRPEPKHALDYGCGVGRILLPLAKECGNVTGVDISPNMLAETMRNLENEKIENFRLLEANEFTAEERETYDFVHSYIVLQHIEPAFGYGIIAKMLERLEAGGLGMIHVTYSSSATGFLRFRANLYRDYPAIHNLLNRLRGRTESPMPPMPMHEYSREKVFEILRENGCEKTFERPTDHGFVGEMIFFRKAENTANS